MPHSLSRRTVLLSGAVSAGMLAGSACSGPRPDMQPDTSSHPPFLTSWSPPADLHRDLTPGTTAIRLASWSRSTTLDYNRDSGISITGMVKRIREAGYTSGNASIRRSIWLEAHDSEIRELHEALDKFDVTFFDMHTTGSNIHPDPKEREKVYRYTVDSCAAAECKKTGINNVNVSVLHT